VKSDFQRRMCVFGAWCGLAYTLMLLVGWGLVAGFIPPHRPSAGIDAIAAIFKEDALRIRIGMVIVMFAGAVVAPFFVAVSQVLARVEGGFGVLALSALVGGVGTIVLTFYPAIWWLIAAYRPERSPELVYLMNDMAWLQFIGGVSLFLVVPVCIVVAALNDKSANPCFPRWMAFLNICLLMMTVPDQLLFFFHAGPFAWNGLFGFWIPLVAFVTWFFSTAYMTRRAALLDLQNPRAMWGIGVLT
jgi:hypothetical protein